jgi:hypothetical protein
MQPLLEITFTDSPSVDRDAGIIRGVKVLGRQSRNGREYSDQALHDAARLYEGIGVNLNHADTPEGHKNRSVEAGFGWLADVAVRPEGVFGDLHFFKSHPQAAMIVEAAERNPRRFGLSHHAEGRVANSHGKSVVESIERVRSVDLVQNPATNSGLFESENPLMPAPTPRTIRQILSETDTGRLAPLLDDNRLAPLADRALDLPADASPADQLAAAAHALLEASLAAPTLATLATPSNAEVVFAELVERIERLETLASCRELLETHRRACDGTRLTALAALPSADERVRLIESWPESAGSLLPSGRSPRPTISPPLVDADPVCLPQDAKALAAALR